MYIFDHFYNPDVFVFDLISYFKHNAKLNPLLHVKFKLDELYFLCENWIVVFYMIGKLSLWFELHFVSLNKCKLQRLKAFKTRVQLHTRMPLNIFCLFVCYFIPHLWPSSQNAFTIWNIPFVQFLMKDWWELMRIRLKSFRKCHRSTYMSYIPQNCPVLTEMTILACNIYILCQFDFQK